MKDNGRRRYKGWREVVNTVANLDSLYIWRHGSAFHLWTDNGKHESYDDESNFDDNADKMNRNIQIPRFFSQH